MGPTLIIELLGLLMLPACAIVAGFFVWLTSRGETASDGRLLGTFVVVLLAGMLVSWKVLRSDAVHMRLDPVFKLEKDLEAHRLYSTIKELSPDDSKKLTAALAKQWVDGATLPQAFIRARPLLTDLVRERVAFADQKTSIAWARSLIGTYKRFAMKDADLCYALIGRHSIDSKTVTTAFDDEDERKFEDLAIEIYQSADRGLSHQYPADEKPADFNETAREFSAIQDQVESEYGKEIATLLRKHEFPADTTLNHREICRARIYQLDLMLERPQAKAAMLVRSVLR